MSQPERVAQLVVMNTGIYSGRPPSETWLRFRDLVRRTGTDFDPGRLIQLTCVRELEGDVVAAYNAPFPTPDSKTGVLMFPELVPTDPKHPSAGPPEGPSRALPSPKLVEPHLAKRPYHV